MNPTGSSTSSALGWDAKILQDALREAVRTSPGSFLKTVKEVEAEPLDYWINEVRSSTWAVAQRGEDIVGIVAAKPPDSDKDVEDQAITRYIESVWIIPDLRGNGLGWRLIKYLLEAEYRKNQHIRQFLLWVFATNSSAIGLYERMGFVPTGETKTLKNRIERKYRLDFDTAIHLAVGWAVNDDTRQYGVTYRILGGR